MTFCSSDHAVKKNPKLCSRRSFSGVTLIELMVTVAVMAILASLAIPSFQGALATSRISSNTNDLIAAISQARSQAIRLGMRVTLCKSSDGATCSTSGNWEQGWIMFIDKTRSGSTAAFDVGDTLIKNFQGKGGNNILILGNSAVEQYISFGADGTGKTIGGAPLTGTIRICSISSALTDAQRARDLVMSFTGRVVMEKNSISNSCPAPA